MCDGRAWRHNRAAEAEWIRQRREAVGLDPEGTGLSICLAGGGVRAATFALGALQGLARSGVLVHTDRVCSVSGGGYSAAGMIGWLAQQPSDHPAARFGPGFARATPEHVRHVRAHAGFFLSSAERVWSAGRS